jgi:hypothetical protein
MMQNQPLCIDKRSHDHPQCTGMEGLPDNNQVYNPVMCNTRALQIPARAPSATMQKKRKIRNNARNISNPKRDRIGK